MANGKPGKPRIEIDQEQFEKLCTIQCTLEEIADWFRCSEDTIENWCKRTYQERFKEVTEKFRSKGKASLRRMQFKLAERNASMAIFLGKQYLGQKDYVENAINNNGIIDDLVGALNNVKKSK